MTPPLSIDDEVIVTGPDCSGYVAQSIQNFKINRIWKYGNEMRYIGKDIQLWYPASSLRLVEELKIGDLVEITGDPVGIWCDEDKGHVCEIVDIKESRNIRLRGKLFTYPTKSLRKLSPEEIQQHTSTIGYQAQKCNAELEKAKEAMRKILAPLVDERLSGIESRLDKLGSSHSELMGDVEALAEGVGAIEKRLTSIEKRQREQHERMDRFMQDYREHKDFDFDMHDRIKVLEGERPEVCDMQPNAGSIRVSIQRGNDPARIFFDTCAFDCQIWAKKVLDSMKEA